MADRIVWCRAGARHRYAGSLWASGDRIRLIDSECVSIGIAMLALDVQRLLERGTTDEEISALAHKQFVKQGIVLNGSTPAEMDAFLKSEIAKWAKVV